MKPTLRTFMFTNLKGGKDPDPGELGALYWHNGTMEPISHQMPPTPTSPPRRSSGQGGRIHCRQCRRTRCSMDLSGLPAASDLAPSGRWTNSSKILPLTISSLQRGKRAAPSAPVADLKRPWPNARRFHGGAFSCLRNCREPYLSSADLSLVYLLPAR